MTFWKVLSFTSDWNIAFSIFSRASLASLLVMIASIYFYHEKFLAFLQFWWIFHVPNNQTWQLLSFRTWIALTLVQGRVKPSSVNSQNEKPILGIKAKLTLTKNLKGWLWEFTKDHGKWVWMVSFFFQTAKVKVLKRITYT